MQVQVGDSTAHDFYMRRKINNYTLFLETWLLKVALDSFKNLKKKFKTIWENKKWISLR